MIEVLYTCTLLSDVVLNSKLATEGNMETLDFIPGSNFLGIVANDIYKNHESEAYDILHSSKVLFGDAHISDKHNLRSYTMPLVLVKAKSGKGKTLVQYAIDKVTNDQLRADGTQLKQERKGYFTETGVHFKDVKKDFALKSAQDRTTRSSLEGNMFGVSSLVKGQIFTFTIKYESDDLQTKVEAFLIGKKQIGKSKTAQFGQVEIKSIGKAPAVNHFPNKDFHVVYAESNLCFFSDLGHPTFQPVANDLGINGGEICWEKSQIRTYSYSPWNFKRNTPNTQRHCIQKGSVFYVKGGTINNPDNVVGEYTNEGLGRVLYNPSFLQADHKAIWSLNLQLAKYEDKDKKTHVPINSPLGKFLDERKKEKCNFEKIAKAVHDAVYDSNSNISLKEISPSQWGEVRAKATSAPSVDELKKVLFTDEKAFLKSGVSAKRYWDKNRNREKFEAIIKANCHLGTVFIARYAEEMAKKSLKPNKENGK